MGHTKSVKARSKRSIYRQLKSCSKNVANKDHVGVKRRVSTEGNNQPVKYNISLDSPKRTRDNRLDTKPTNQQDRRRKVFLPKNQNIDVQFPKTGIQTNPDQPIQDVNKKICKSESIEKILNPAYFDVEHQNNSKASDTSLDRVITQLNYRPCLETIITENSNSCSSKPTDSAISCKQDRHEILLNSPFYLDAVGKLKKINSQNDSKEETTSSKTSVSNSFTKKKQSDQAIDLPLKKVKRTSPSRMKSPILNNKKRNSNLRRRRNLSKDMGQSVEKPRVRAKSCCQGSLSKIYRSQSKSRNTAVLSALSLFKKENLDEQFLAKLLKEYKTAKLSKKRKDKRSQSTNRCSCQSSPKSDVGTRLKKQNNSIRNRSKPIKSKNKVITHKQTFKHRKLKSPSFVKSKGLSSSPDICERLPNFATKVNHLGLLNLKDAELVGCSLNSFMERDDSFMSFVAPPPSGYHVRNDFSDAEELYEPAKYPVLLTNEMTYMNTRPDSVESEHFNYTCSHSSQKVYKQSVKRSKSFMMLETSDESDYYDFNKRVKKKFKRKQSKKLGKITLIGKHKNSNFFSTRTSSLPNRKRSNQVRLRSTSNLVSLGAENRMLKYDRKTLNPNTMEVDTLPISKDQILFYYEPVLNKKSKNEQRVKRMKKPSFIKKELSNLNNNARDSAKEAPKQHVSFSKTSKNIFNSKKINSKPGPEKKDKKQIFFQNQNLNAANSDFKIKEKEINVTQQAPQASDVSNADTFFTTTDHSNRTIEQDSGSDQDLSGIFSTEGVVAANVDDTFQTMAQNSGNAASDFGKNAKKYLVKEKTKSVEYLNEEIGDHNERKLIDPQTNKESSEQSCDSIAQSAGYESVEAFLQDARKVFQSMPEVSNEKKNLDILKSDKSEAKPGNDNSPPSQSVKRNVKTEAIFIKLETSTKKITKSMKEVPLFCEFIPKKEIQHESSIAQSPKHTKILKHSIEGIDSLKKNTRNSLESRVPLIKGGKSVVIKKSSNPSSVLSPVTHGLYKTKSNSSVDKSKPKEEKREQRDRSLPFSNKLKLRNNVVTTVSKNQITTERKEEISLADSAETSEEANLEKTPSVSTIIATNIDSKNPTVESLNDTSFSEKTSKSYKTSRSADIGTSSISVSQDEVKCSVEQAAPDNLDNLDKEESSIKENITTKKKPEKIKKISRVRKDSMRSPDVKLKKKRFKSADKVKIRNNKSSKVRTAKKRSESASAKLEKNKLKLKKQFSSDTEVAPVREIEDNVKFSRKKYLPPHKSEKLSPMNNAKLKYKLKKHVAKSSSLSLQGTQTNTSPPNLPDKTSLSTPQKEERQTSGSPTAPEIKNNSLSPIANIDTDTCCESNKSNEELMDSAEVNSPESLTNLSSKKPKIKTKPRSQRDLLAAEHGWDSSFCKKETYCKKVLQRRPRLRYKLSKARPKGEERESALKSQSKKEKNATRKCDKQPVEVKSVQFAENIIAFADVESENLLIHDVTATQPHVSEPVENVGPEQHLNDSSISIASYESSSVKDITPPSVQLPPPNVTAPARPSLSSIGARKPFLKLKKANFSKESSQDVKSYTSERVTDKRIKLSRRPLPRRSLTRSISGVRAQVEYNPYINDYYCLEPMDRTTKKKVATAGSPVDIKEIIEGSSVDGPLFPTFNARVQRSAPSLGFVKGDTSNRTGISHLSKPKRPKLRSGNQKNSSRKKPYRFLSPHDKKCLDSFSGYHKIPRQGSRSSLDSSFNSPKSTDLDEAVHGVHPPGHLEKSGAKIKRLKKRNKLSLKEKILNSNQLFTCLPSCENIVSHVSDYVQCQRWASSHDVLNNGFKCMLWSVIRHVAGLPVVSHSDNLVVNSSSTSCGDSFVSISEPLEEQDIEENVTSQAEPPVVSFPIQNMFSN